MSEIEQTTAPIKDNETKPEAKAPLTDEPTRPCGNIEEQALIAAKEGYSHLFSIVVAVYNVQDFVEETIQSVVDQTVGFDNIQLVLVNDGSTDDSASICASFAREHPENVVFIDKENGGVSSARNAGIAAATGKYLNFLDSDDLWSLDALEWALDFFAAHPDVKLAAAKYVNFGRIEGDHRLNYKFKETKVVDLRECYDYPQLSSSTCFFHSSLLEGRAYNEELSVSEDVLLVNEILLDELQYGVMSQPVYHYRQREDRGSAVDTMKDNVSWYFDTPRLCYQRLFDLSREKHGCILPFIQYTVMYDLQWRIRSKISETLDEGQRARYRDLLISLLRQIDDHIIAEQKTISTERVAYALTLKYGTTMDYFLDHMVLDGEYLACKLTDEQGEDHIVKLRTVAYLSNALIIKGASYSDGYLHVSGLVNTFRFRPKDIELRAEANNTPVDATIYITEERKPTMPFGEDVPGKTGFSLDIELPLGYEIRLKMTLSLLQATPKTCQFWLGEDEAARDKYAEAAYMITPSTLIRLATAQALTIRVFNAPLSDEDLETERAAAEAYRSEVLTALGNS